MYKYYDRDPWACRRMSNDQRPNTPWYQSFVEVCQTAYGLDTSMAQHDSVVTLAYRFLLSQVRIRWWFCIVIPTILCFWLEDARTQVGSPG